jgi:LPXTG-motif cell wall-anchored protein
MITRNTSTSAWGSRLAGFAIVLQSPAVAAAGWGNENWGEMIWGGAMGVPTLPGPGLGVLAIALLAMGFFLARRRRRSAR